MKKLSIGMVVFCFMMMASVAVWAENRVPIPPNGTILDTNTGLVWLQNANCFGTKTWQEAMSTAAGLKSGSCGLSDGSTAGKWRLPTSDELIARQKNQQGFTNVQLGWYWSGTESYTLYVWHVRMLDGKELEYDKKLINYVWPVRSGQ